MRIYLLKNFKEKEVLSLNLYKKNMLILYYSEFR